MVDDTGEEDTSFFLSSFTATIMNFRRKPLKPSKGLPDIIKESIKVQTSNVSFANVVSTEKIQSKVREVSQRMGNKIYGFKCNDKIMGYKSKGNFVYRPVLTLNWNGVARKNGEENKKKSNSNTNIASTSQDRGKSVVSTANAFSIRSDDNMLKDKENKSGNVLEVLRILLKWWNLMRRI
ncbi:hypothetical protein Tco_0458177 [Tanacetum coccineum]